MKNKVNKLFTLLLAVIIVFSAIPVGAFAATREMTLRVDSVAGSAGSEVKVKLSLEGNPGVASIGLTLTYGDILTLKSVEFNTEMGGSTQLPPTLSSPVKMIWVNGAYNYTVPDAVFATLTFQISESASDGSAAELTISHDPDDIYDIGYNNVALNVIDGSVSVLSCIPGDINGDDKVNNKDVSFLMQHLAGWNVAVNAGTLDANGDDKVNNRDVSILMQYLAGWPVTLHCICGRTTQRCDHTMEAVPFKAASCTAEGNIAYWHCTKCDKYFNSAAGTTEIKLADTVIKETHVLESIAYKAPTATVSGNIAYWRCTLCGKCFLDANAAEVVEVGDTILEPNAEGVTIVQYDLYGGDNYLRKLGVENPNSNEFDSEKGMNLSPLTAPDGYNFKGWRLVDGTAEGTPITRLAPQNSGTTLRVRAVWELIPYTITYKNYMTPVGQVVDSEAKSYTVNQGKPNLPNPEVKNYVFLGWYNEDGQEVTSIPTGTTGDIVLDGYWTSLRNIARAKKLGDPIILENTTDGIIYFAYELGTIENIPVSDAVWTLQSVAGLEQQVSKTVTTSIGTEQAENIAKTISEETVDSGTWTLSEQWNDSTQVNESWAEQKGMTVEEATARTKTSSNTFSITDSTGGTDSMTATDGTTTLTYNSQNKATETGSNFDVSVNAKYSNSTELSASATVKGSIGVAEASATAGVKNTSTFEIGGSVGYGNYDKNTVNTHSGSDTTRVNTKVASNTSSWNSSATQSSTQSASESSSVSKALSQVVSSEKGYGKTYAHGTSGSESQGFSKSSSNSVNSSSALSYSKAETVTTTTTYSSDGRLEGKYRLVIAGTAHVFGVVGYDIASRSYFTYTYSVMDDKTYEFLDYTPKGYDFDDYENSVLPFEIPFEVAQYVNEAIVMTDGLACRTNSTTHTATVVRYEGDSTDVTIPSYISSGGTMYKVTGLSASAFSGKPIRAVMLGKFIDEIPDGAFKNCTALEEVTGRFTKIGAEAFSGCNSLKSFTVSNSVISIGADAFAGALKVTVKAVSGDKALALAKEQSPEASDGDIAAAAILTTQQLVNAAVCAGAQELVLDLSSTMDGVSFALDVPASMTRFELLGGNKAFADMKLISRADKTVLRNAAIEDYNTIPLEIYSNELTLEVVNVKSTNFALVMAASHPEIILRRDSSLTSSRGNAVVFKDPTISAQVIENTLGSLEVSGNVYVCGTIAGRDDLFVSNGHVTIISEEEFNKYITGKYTVTLDPNEGSLSQTTATVTFGQPFGTLPTPARDHYSFSGWYTDPTNGDLVTAETMFEELKDITLYAHWTLSTFNISLNANGGSVTQNSVEVVYGNQVGTLPTPTRDYYNFDGWYTAASGGTMYTATTTFDTASDIILYAHWTLKPISDWVLASSIPAGAQTVNQKWTYNQRTNTESRSTSLSGYTQYGSYWVQSGSGSTNYASFPSGFDTNHSIYTSMAKSPYSASETTTAKRTVLNSWTGYVYYHWAYNAALYNVTARSISGKYIGSGTNGYCYGYFYAFKDSTAYPYLDNSYCNGQNLPSYNCWDAVKGYNGQNISGLCTPRFLRFDYYTSTYTDYYKMFQYYKIDAKESSSAVTAGGLITNVQHWVQYRAK